MRFEFEEIKNLIPQRFPFIMIDRILHVEPGKGATAIKNISGNDHYMPGHFPDKAVLPGVLIIEAMAQTAIVLFAAAKNKNNAKLLRYYLGSVKARFTHPVLPGDQLRIEVVNVKSLPAVAYVSAEAFVEDKKVSEAELAFSMKDE